MSTILEILRNIANNSELSDLILMWILAIICLLGAFVDHSRRIMNIVILLLFIYFLTGSLFIFLRVDYLGFMFLIIYAGAIVILFIFVLMLVQLKNLIGGENLLRFFSVLFKAIGIIILGFFFWLFLMGDFRFMLYVVSNTGDIMIMPSQSYLLLEELLLNWKFFQDSTEVNELSNILKLGLMLFRELWFETLFIGVGLVLALIFIIYFFKK